MKDGQKERTTFYSVFLIFLNSSQWLSKHICSGCHNTSCCNKLFLSRSCIDTHIISISLYSNVAAEGPGEWAPETQRATAAAGPGGVRSNRLGPPPPRRLGGLPELLWAPAAAVWPRGGGGGHPNHYGPSPPLPWGPGCVCDKLWLGRDG